MSPSSMYVCVCVHIIALIHIVLFSFLSLTRFGSTIFHLFRRCLILFFSIVWKKVASGNGQRRKTMTDQNIFEMDTNIVFVYQDIRLLKKNLSTGNTLSLSFVFFSFFKLVIEVMTRQVSFQPQLTTVSLILLLVYIWLLSCYVSFSKRKKIKGPMKKKKKKARRQKNVKPLLVFLFFYINLKCKHTHTHY